MSDKGAVTGKVTRKKKVKKKGKGIRIERRSFVLESQKVSEAQSKNWNRLWPEFLEKLKKLCDHYRITIKRV
jgi:gas vesicle protein